MQHRASTVALITGLSGFCSLVYQVVWDRTVKYNFGGDSISSAIVSGTFLLGLGLGAWLFGRSRGNAYRTYALIELAIGLFAIFSFYLISPVAESLAAVLQTGPDQVEGLRPVVVVGCILLLLPPCTLIGGTLPLMFRCFISPSGFSTRAIGLVYGINTIGASIGILAVPIVFLNHLSLPVTLAIAGSVNIGLGLFILFLGRGTDRAVPTPAGPALPSGRLAGAELPRLLFVLAFVSGFVAIAFEVSLFRAFQIVNPSSAYNFPAVLAPFLLALALGSIVFTRGVADDRRLILGRIGWLLALSALAMFLAIRAAAWLQDNHYPVSLRPIVDAYGGSRTLFFTVLFSTVLVMPVPFLTGAIFPLLLRLRTSGGTDLPESTGTVYLVNSLGAFSGALLGKFIGFGYFGTQGFLTFLYVLSCAAGLGILGWLSWNGAGRAAGRNARRPAAVLAMCIGVAAAMPAGAWRTYVTGSPQPNWEVREGVTGVAQIWWEQGFGDVRVNGQYMSRLPYHPRHVKQSVFLLSQPRRERVLVLGIGGAGIIRSLVEDPGVRHIDVVDWSYELPDLLSQGRAGDMLNHTLASPKVRIVKADARVAVGLFPKDSFDLVFDNLAFASWAGSSNINSEKYFRKVRSILKPEGVFVKAANYRGENRLAVLAGLVATFDLVEEHGKAEVVISSRRRPDYSDSRIREVLAPRAAEFELAPPLVEWFRGGFATITKADLHGVRPIRDDLLIYEYYWNPLRF